MPVMRTKIKEGDPRLAVSLNSKRILEFDRVFGSLWSPTGDFDNTDVIMILDCCYSGTATRGMKQYDRSIATNAAVGMNQKAPENAYNQIRMQNRTFTSRLADEIARIVTNKKIRHQLAFAETIAAMPKTSKTERLLEYFLSREEHRHKAGNSDYKPYQDVKADLISAEKIALREAVLVEHGHPKT